MLAVAFCQSYVIILCSLLFPAAFSLLCCYQSQYKLLVPIICSSYSEVEIFV